MVIDGGTGIVTRASIMLPLRRAACKATLISITLQAVLLLCPAGGPLLRATEQSMFLRHQLVL